ncbi:GNAT family N-acetyltransferase [Mechercharimyces sp. CAU 1602]|uniref:GNAT family N-acetyltransferase n=1 Tax=Mechercharimyces sp. CAU 1602 TaxID=2973933 RepID=UPI002161273A|nr:GNAT family N-acetyltransferase [Mechercharimyces sp. CAU 1602]MCS1351841.1 GNAT family N-acetyltransferase [Mechercharimyces sp. CAU 1602]
MEIKPLSALSEEEILQVWNAGFRGYALNVQMTLEQLRVRIQNEELNSEKSVVAILDGQAVGFIMNGFRGLGGNKVAWNGGTGVVPSYRGKGVGQALVQATLALYEHEFVDIATLEALHNNQSAIQLYRRNGYEAVDALFIHKKRGALPLSGEQSDGFQLDRVDPATLGELPFYRLEAPWQSHWHSVRDGEAAVVKRVGEGNPIGYALWKRVQEPETGIHQATVLYQCEIEHGIKGKAREEVVHLLLTHLYEPHKKELNRSTFNIPATNRTVMNALRNAGFLPFVQQVQMVKKWEH